MVWFAMFAVIMTMSVAATLSELSSAVSATHISRSAANRIGCTATHPISLRKCTGRRSGSPRSTSVSQPSGAIVTAMAGMGCVLPIGMAAMTALFCYRHRGTAGQIADGGSAQESSASGEDADPAGVEKETDHDQHDTPDHRFRISRRYRRPPGRRPRIRPIRAVNSARLILAQPFGCAGEARTLGDRALISPGRPLRRPWP